MKDRPCSPNSRRHSACNHPFDKNGNKLREWQQKPFISFIVSGKDVSYLEFFKKLKERTDIIVAVQELCLFRIVDGSHSPYNVTRIYTADNNKNLEIVEWKCYRSVYSNNNKLFLISKFLDVIEEVVSGLD
jgi:hypothetical protein